MRSRLTDYEIKTGRKIEYEDGRSDEEVNWYQLSLWPWYPARIVHTPPLRTTEVKDRKRSTHQKIRRPKHDIIR